MPLYNSDDRAKWLMNNNPDIISKVKALFGNESYVKGELNRAHISALAFNDKTLIGKLNQTVHPAVFNDFDDWVLAQQAPYILKEAALLFESGSYLTLDAMIVVDAPLETRISRVMKRDGFSRDDIMKRIANQLPDELKNNAADFIINNNGDPLLPQILHLHLLWT